MSQYVNLWRERGPTFAFLFCIIFQVSDGRSVLYTAAQVRNGNTVESSDKAVWDTHNEDPIASLLWQYMQCVLCAFKV